MTKIPQQENSKNPKDKRNWGKEFKEKKKKRTYSSTVELHFTQGFGLHFNGATCVNVGHKQHKLIPNLSYKSNRLQPITIHHNHNRVTTYNFTLPCIFLPINSQKKKTRLVFVIMVTGSLIWNSNLSIHIHPVPKYMVPNIKAQTLTSRVAYFCSVFLDWPIYAMVGSKAMWLNWFSWKIVAWIWAVNVDVVPPLQQFSMKMLFKWKMEV